MEDKVRKFAQNMQDELNSNSKKGNWEEFTNINSILLELEYHKAKLLMALRDGDKDKVKEYIADCANELLFLSNATDTL